MNPLTALVFILLGMLTLLNTSIVEFSFKRQAVKPLILLFSGILFILIASIATTDYHLDKLMFNRSIGTSQMSKTAVLSFLLLIIAIALSQAKRSNLLALSQYVAIVPLCIGLVYFCAYAFDLNPLTSTRINAPLAINTSVCFVALSLSVLIKHPQLGFVDYITEKSAGGELARRMLPILLIVPFTVGLLRSIGQHLGFYSTEFGTSIFVVIVTLLSTIHLVYQSRVLTKIDLDRKHFEDVLKISENTFSKAFNHSLIGMGMISPDGSWLNVNFALCNMLGYSREELLNLTFQDLTFPDDLKNDLFHLKRTLEGDIDNFKVEKRFVHKGGHVVLARSVMSLVREDGVPKYFISQITDITSIKSIIKTLRSNNVELAKATTKAEEATRSKSEFLSTMSHEIRTPMNAVIGFTNLLLENPRPDQKESLEMLRFSGENLLVLINDILTHNKIEAGMIQLESIEINVKDFLSNIKSVLNPSAQEKGIQLTVLTEDNIPQYIIGDAVRLGQVIINLAGNAIKFTEAGRVTIATSVINSDTVSTTLRFEIRDTGIGIEQHKQEQIFNSYTQASSDTTRKYGGTGLGLGIANKLLELYGSKLKVESEPGKGSCFHFEISLGNCVAKANSFSNAAKDKKSLKGITVLLAEDNKINVLLAKQFMKLWDVKCEVAENGLEAYKMVQERHYDLILMDLQMPVMDGYQASQAIRCLAGEQYKSIPIIALTASAMKDVAIKIEDAGMNDLITKPFKPDDLFDRIYSYTQPEITELTALPQLNLL